jgi:hypothetical protein
LRREGDEVDLHLANDELISGTVDGDSTSEVGMSYEIVLKRIDFCFAGQRLEFSLRPLKPSKRSEVRVKLAQVMRDRTGRISGFAGKIKKWHCFLPQSEAETWATEVPELYISIAPFTCLVRDVKDDGTIIVTRLKPIAARQSLYIPGRQLGGTIVAIGRNLLVLSFGESYGVLRSTHVEPWHVVDFTSLDRYELGQTLWVYVVSSDVLGREIQVTLIDPQDRRRHRCREANELVGNRSTARFVHDDESGGFWLEINGLLARMAKPSAKMPNSTYLDVDVVRIDEAAQHLVVIPRRGENIG